MLQTGKKPNENIFAEKNAKQAYHALIFRAYLIHTPPYLRLR